MFVTYLLWPGFLLSRVSLQSSKDKHCHAISQNDKNSVQKVKDYIRLPLNYKSVVPPFFFFFFYI